MNKILLIITILLMITALSSCGYVCPKPIITIPEPLAREPFKQGDLKCIGARLQKLIVTRTLLCDKRVDILTEKLKNLIVP